MRNEYSGSRGILTGSNFCRVGLYNFFFNIFGSQPDTTSWNIAWFTLCQKEEGGGRESKM